MATNTLLRPAPATRTLGYRQWRRKDATAPIRNAAWTLNERLAQIQMPRDFQAFGVEMELLIPRRVGRRRLEQAIHLAGGTGNWRAKDDDSLVCDDAGYMPLEVVSPKLTGSEGLQQLANVCAAISELDPEINSSCGLHVHVGYGSHGQTPWDLSVLHRVVFKWLLHEPAMDLLVPADRRDSHNEHCTSLLRGFCHSYLMRKLPRTTRQSLGLQAYTELLQTAEHKFSVGISEARLLDTGQRQAYALSEIQDMLQACQSRDELRTCFNPNSRDFKLNLHALTFHNTVEFRHPGGTWDASEVAHFVLLYTRFLEQSSASSWPGPARAEKRGQGALQHLIHDMYSSNSALDQQLRAWIHDRARQLELIPLKDMAASRHVLHAGPGTIY